MPDPTPAPQEPDVEAIAARLEAATPGPWRSVRASWEDGYGQEWHHPEVWGIAAGEQTTRQNKGHFHPEDATYTMDETTVVEIGFDRDYDTAEAAISREADATFIANAPTDIAALLDALAAEKAAHAAALNRADMLQQVIDTHGHEKLLEFWYFKDKLAAAEAARDQALAERDELQRLIDTHDAMREEGQCPSPIGCYALGTTPAEHVEPTWNPKDVPISDQEITEFEQEQREWFDIGPDLLDVGPTPDFCLRLVATIRDLQRRLDLAEHVKERGG